MKVDSHPSSTTPIVLELTNRKAIQSLIITSSLNKQTFSVSLSFPSPGKSLSVYQFKKVMSYVVNPCFVRRVTGGIYEQYVERLLSLTLFVSSFRSTITFVVQRRRQQGNQSK